MNLGINGIGSDDARNVVSADGSSTAANQPGQQIRPEEQAQFADTLNRRGSFPDAESARQEFEDQLRARNIVIPEGGAIADGRIHRCAVEGKGRNNRDAAYVLHLDGIPAGGFENHCDGLGWQKWHAKTQGKLSAAEISAHKYRVKGINAEREREKARGHRQVAEETLRILERAMDATPADPYLKCKGIQPHNLFEDDEGRLIMPLYDEHGQVHSRQTIDAEGNKRFPYRGRKEGLFYNIGEVPTVGDLLIGEGFATMASCHAASGIPASQPLIAAISYRSQRRYAPSSQM
jgi:putative DNA primase/helicase